MFRFLSIVTFFMVIVISNTPTASQGDELLLINGDRLTGKVIRMEGDLLYYSTPYVSTEMEIAWKDVANLITDEDVQIVLEDGTTLNGRTMKAEDGKVKMKMGSFIETVSFDLAQVTSVNPKKNEAKKMTLKGIVNAGFSQSSGNTDTTSVYIDTEVVARTPKNRYTIGLEYNYENDNDETTERNALGYAKYDYFLTNKWYLYSNSFFQTDPVADLRLRTTLGIGAGYQFFETERTQLSVEAGPAYVNEDLEEGEDMDFSAARWAVDFNHALYDWLETFHFQEGYYGLEGSDNLFLRTRTGLRFPFAEAFHFTLQYNWDYDKSPAEGASSVDREYVTTLGYSFD